MSKYRKQRERDTVTDENRCSAARGSRVVRGVRPAVWRDRSPKRNVGNALSPTAGYIPRLYNTYATAPPVCARARVEAPVTREEQFNFIIRRLYERRALRASPVKPARLPRTSIKARSTRVIALRNIKPLRTQRECGVISSAPEYAVALSSPPRELGVEFILDSFGRLSCQFATSILFSFYSYCVHIFSKY